jgi:lysyl-tRNA synthetase class 1
MTQQEEDNATTQTPLHWTEEVAKGTLERVHELRGTNQHGKIVCASGISPSGPVHLGNAREIFTAHFVAEELRSQGHHVEHVHFWDDYDRLRKIPKGVPDEWQGHLGKPLCDVPDPCGKHLSYAEHFIDDFSSRLPEIGVRPTYIRQSEAYRRGDYREMCKVAIVNRLEIFDILADYQSDCLQTETIEERRAKFFPFRVYCHACNKDTTTIRSYEEITTSIYYTCACGHANVFSLNDDANHGKLVWKVDWPMRWHQMQVDFEPGGEDHSGPASSFVVGKRIIRSVFGGIEPHYVSYAFVGRDGTTKLSSSAGAEATPRAALDIFEPAVLRWLYLRRRPNKAFSIDFGKAMIGIYDEWDRLTSKVDANKAGERDIKIVARCRETSTGKIAAAAMPVSFRVLVAAADISQGNQDVMLRIVGDHLAAPVSREVLEPRFGCALRWATSYMPDAERTVIRDEFSAEAWAEVGDEQRDGIAMLLDMMADYWSLDGLTKLVYGIPKLQAGLDMDAKTSKELKVSQRAFFIAIYTLLCSSETGPRLPTFFLALGRNKVRDLLHPSQNISHNDS